MCMAKKKKCKRVWLNCGLSVQVIVSSLQHVLYASTHETIWPLQMHFPACFAVLLWSPADTYMCIFFPVLLGKGEDKEYPTIGARLIRLEDKVGTLQRVLWLTAEINWLDYLSHSWAEWCVCVCETLPACVCVCVSHEWVQWNLF